ncbi:hypothetical protein D3C85_1018630 [compost metagenome]
MDVHRDVQTDAFLVERHQFWIADGQLMLETLHIQAAQTEGADGVLKLFKRLRTPMGVDRREADEARPMLLAKLRNDLVGNLETQSRLGVPCLQDDMGRIEPVVHAEILGERFRGRLQRNETLALAVDAPIVIHVGSLDRELGQGRAAGEIDHHGAYPRLDGLFRSMALSGKKQSCTDSPLLNNRVPGWLDC